MPTCFQLRVDQLPIHPYFISTTVRGDQLNLRDNIAIFLTQGTLQTEGSGGVVSRDTILNRNAMH